MARTLAVLLSLLAAGLAASEARGRSVELVGALPPISGHASTLAPFQHVRFCLHYPADCKPDDPKRDARVEFNPQTIELIKRINRNVNQAIIPRNKNYEKTLKDGWTIAPSSGDCNDYAVTKRHELLKNGFPSSALLLSVLQTPSGVGHLVLIVATTKQDVVMDNLTDAVIPWQETDYRWLKIQSPIDPRNWNQVDQTTASLSSGSQAYNSIGPTVSPNLAP